MSCGSEVLYPSFSGRDEPTLHIALLGGCDGTYSLDAELTSQGCIVTQMPKSFESLNALVALEPRCAVLADGKDIDIPLIRSCLALGVNIVVVASEDSEILKDEEISTGCAYFQYTVTAEQVRHLCDGWVPTLRARGTPASAEDIVNLYQHPPLGNSTVMQEINTQIAKVAPTKASVLITGESGTGKEVVAELIHRLSRRREQPFLPVNCGAIPAQLTESEFFGHTKGSFTGAVRDHSGYFERAHKGTLFLDEITEMPIELQVKLLRVLETQRFFRLGSDQERKIDIRVVAATNRDPETAVEEGFLRRDLLYRIRIFPVHLPRLRDREDDVKQFAQHFLNEFNTEERTTKHFSAGAMDALLGYEWPGNIRELKNAVYRAFIMSGQIINTVDLPAEVNRTLPDSSGLSQKSQVGRTLEDVEKDLIIATLDHCRGRRDKAAAMLGVSVKTLYNRLRTYQKHDVSCPSKTDSFNSLIGKQLGEQHSTDR